MFSILVEILSKFGIATNVKFMEGVKYKTKCCLAHFRWDVQNQVPHRMMFSFSIILMQLQSAYNECHRAIFQPPKPQMISVQKAKQADIWNPEAICVIKWHQWSQDSKCHPLHFPLTGHSEFRGTKPPEASKTCRLLLIAFVRLLENSHWG